MTVKGGNVGIFKSPSMSLPLWPLWSAYETSIVVCDFPRASNENMEKLSMVLTSCSLRRNSAEALKSFVLSDH